MSKFLGLRRPSPQQDTTEKEKKKSGSNPPALAELRHSSMDHIKRPSLGLAKKHGSSERKDKDKKDRSMSKDKHAKDASRQPPKPKPVSLAMIMESPPALFIDQPQHSSGALISGRLQVSPRAGDVVMNSITMYLECTTTTKRPVQDRCRECMANVSDLYEWNFLSKAKTFRASEGMQELPFSHLIPGHIPSTTHGEIGSIEYSLHVRAKSDDGQETEFRREMVINRALRPGNDKMSIRIFPPTNLTLHVTLPSIVHPIGDFNITAKMTGMTQKRDDTQTRWRLRKLTWRIEEHEQVVSPACAQHASKVGGEGKGVQHQVDRSIGQDDLKQGWKTDLEEGEIEGEFVASIDNSDHPQCDIDAPNGLKIWHNLVLEMVIAEEWAPNKKPQQATPTGAARVLRTQFSLNVTERLGLGLSWDDEMPPMYEDVPASPPRYQNEHTRVEDYEGPDLQGEIEQLSLE